MNIHNNVHKNFKIGWVLLIFVAASLLLGGCKSEKVYRVGILSGLDFAAPLIDGFKSKMTELGYVEGENIVYDVQSTNFDIAAYQRILQKFVADKVDLIFVFPTEASLEAKAATEGTDIPVIFDFALIEGMGLVESIREPGGNVTGVRYPGPDIALKRFEILLQLMPDVKTVWIPYQKDYPIVLPQLEALRPAAEAAGITLIEFPAVDANELKAELDARAASGDPGIDAILLIAEPLTTVPDAYAVIGQFSYAQNVPIPSGLITENYSSISLVNVDLVKSGELAAPLADKVLSGTHPSSIPVASSEILIQINFIAAQTFGLTVPDALLKQADEVIH